MLALAALLACVPPVTGGGDLVDMWWVAVESSEPAFVGERLWLDSDGTMRLTHEGETLNAEWRRPDEPTLEFYLGFKVGEAAIRPAGDGWHAEFSGLMYDGEWVRVSPW